MKKRKRYRLRTIWNNMNQRCGDKSNKYYGAKGIKVCEEWANDFKAFESWAIDNGYRDDLTIDRIDSNGNYSPDNCRWATVKDQNNNQCTNRLLTIDGETKTLAQWCDIYGLPQYVVDNRLNKYGWDVDRAIKTPNNATNHIGRLIEYNGEKHNIMDWSRITGISYRVLYSRIVEKKWDIERSFETPVQIHNKCS